jgi:hypothetical protein
MTVFGKQQEMCGCCFFSNVVFRYKAVIDAVDANARVFTVTFTEYGNSQLCSVEMVRSLSEVQQLAAPPVASASLHDLPTDLPLPPLAAAKEAPAKKELPKEPPKKKLPIEPDRVISGTIYSADEFLQFIEPAKKVVRVLDVDEDDDFEPQQDSRPTLIDLMQMDQIKGGGKFNIDKVEQRDLEEEELRAAEELHREEASLKQAKLKELKKQEKERILEAERAELEAMNAELAALQEERARLRIEEEEALERAKQEEEERIREEQEEEEEAERARLEEEERMKEQEEEAENQRLAEEERIRQLEDEVENQRLAEEDRIREEEGEAENQRLAEEADRARLEEEERARREEEEERREIEERARQKMFEAEKARLLAEEQAHFLVMKQEAQARAKVMEQFEEVDGGSEEEEESARLAGVAEQEAAAREKIRVAKARAESIKSIGRGTPAVKVSPVPSSTGRGRVVAAGVEQLGNNAEKVALKKQTMKWPPDPVVPDEAEVVTPPLKMAKKVAKKSETKEVASNASIPPKPKAVVGESVPAKKLPVVVADVDEDIEEDEVPKKDSPQVLEDAEDYGTKKTLPKPAVNPYASPLRRTSNGEPVAPPKLPRKPDTVLAKTLPNLPKMEQQPSLPKKAVPAVVLSDEEEEDVVVPPKRVLPNVEVEAPKKSLPVVENDDDEESDSEDLPPLPAPEESSTPRFALPSVPAAADDAPATSGLEEDGASEGDVVVVAPKKSLPTIVSEEFEEETSQLPPIEEEPVVIAPPKKALPAVVDEEGRDSEEGQDDNDDVAPRKSLPRVEDKPPTAKSGPPPPVPVSPRAGTLRDPPKKPIPHAPSPVSAASNLGSASTGGAAGPSRSTAVAAALERARLRKEQANK